MSRMKYALRWRVRSLQAKVHALKVWLRSKLFLLWYREFLGIVEGGEGVSVWQSTRIIGPGKVILGRNIRLGYNFSPSWKSHEILIITKFNDSTLSLGDGTTINNNTSFVVVRKISLGARCKVGHDCQFFDSEMHSIHPEERHTRGDDAGKQKNVDIHDNVMIGAQVTIGPGSEIGENCVVGIRSVVRWKRYPENFVMAGNPARLVMKIDDLLKGQSSCQNDEAEGSD